MATKRRRIFSEFSNDFIESYQFKLKIKFDFLMVPIQKLKYKSTSSHNKICRGMNATNTFTN
jgi:hypothetical protein